MDFIILNFGDSSSSCEELLFFVLSRCAFFGTFVVYGIDELL